MSLRTLSVAAAANVFVLFAYARDCGVVLLML